MSAVKHVYFNAYSGQAVVLLKDCSLCIMQVKSNSTVDGPHKTKEDFDFLKWFQFYQSESIDIDIGPYPFEALQKYLLLQWSAQKLMNCFELVLNHKQPLLFRTRVARMFEDTYIKAKSELTEEFHRKLKTMILKPGIPTKVPFVSGGIGERIWNEMLARARH